MFYFLSKKKIRDKKFGQKLNMKILLNEKKNQIGKFVAYVSEYFASSEIKRNQSLLEGGGGCGLESLSQGLIVITCKKIKNKTVKNSWNYASIYLYNIYIYMCVYIYINNRLLFHTVI